MCTQLFFFLSCARSNGQNGHKCKSISSDPQILTSSTWLSGSGFESDRLRVCFTDARVKSYGTSLLPRALVWYSDWLVLRDCAHTRPFWETQTDAGLSMLLLLLSLITRGIFTMNCTFYRCTCSVRIYTNRIPQMYNVRLLSVRFMLHVIWTRYTRMVLINNSYHIASHEQ